MAQTVKRLQEKEIATHSTTLAWKIPWAEEPCRLQSMGSQRVRHDWVTSLHFNNEYEPLSWASNMVLVVKESACPCRRHMRHWLYPWIGRYPKKEMATCSSILVSDIPRTGEPGGYSLWSCKKSWTQLSLHALSNIVLKGQILNHLKNR